MSKKNKGAVTAAEPKIVTQERIAAPVADFFEQLGGKAVFVVIGLALLMAFIVFKDYLLCEKAYFFKDIGSDTYNSNYPYLYNLCDYVSKHGIPKWSFNFGIGQNIYPFCFREPFVIILALMGKQSIHFAMAYNEVFKIVLSAVVFYYYLKALNLSSYTSIIGSLFFAYSGFMIVGSSWHSFSFEALCLALLLLSFELLLSKRNLYLFVLPIFLLCATQPFNLYVYCLFLATYAVFRLSQEGMLDKQNAPKVLARMVGVGVVGMLLSGVFLLENIVQLLESARGSGATSYSSTLSSVPIFGTIEKSQMGTAILRFFASDMLGTGNDYKGWNNMLEAPLFYCGIPCLLLVPQVFPILEKRVRMAFLIFLGVWLMPLFFPYFRYAFWLFTGDYYRGYCALVAVVFIYYAVKALDHIIRERKINLIILIATVVVLLMLLNYPFFEDTTAINSRVYSFACLLLLAYGAILYFVGKNSTNIDNLKYILLGVVVLELTYFSHISANDRDAATAAELTQRTGYNDYTLDAVAHINKNDKTFFRIDKSYASSPAMHYSRNDGMAQGYHGTTAYSSFNQQYYIYYLQLMGVSEKGNELFTRWARGFQKRPILESENRVKYMLAKKDVEYLWPLICDTVGKFGDVMVLRNKLLLPFGYTYTHYIKESIFDKLSTTQKDFTSLNACVVRDMDVSSMKGLKEYNLRDTLPPTDFNLNYYSARIAELGKDSMVTDKFEETHFSGKINVSEDKMMYLSLPYDAGWQLKVDGNPREKGIVFAGMTGVLLTKGQHTIEMTYELRYFNAGLIMSLIGLVLLVGLVFYMRKMNKQQLA